LLDSLLQEMSQSEQVCPEELKRELDFKIILGRSLLESLSTSSIEGVVGLAKLEKKVRQEVKFLEKFETQENFSKLKKEHIACSNLVHQASVIEQIFAVEDPVAVMQPYSVKHKGGQEKKVVVDIVCDKGHTWVKVVARNPRALDLNCQGGNQYGQRSILDQVKEFVKCAAQNEIMFSPPTVRFVFANGVTKSLRNKILRRGATVHGELVSLNDEEDSDSGDLSEEEDSSSEDSSDEEDSGDEITSEDTNIDTSRVNLDITAMIAYVSALTNGRNWFRFKEKILSEQAQWERDRPVKAFLDSVFLDKELVCCQSAMRDFQKIIATLGGPGEKTRAMQLINRVTVVPDTETQRTKLLGDSGKIKDRSRCIFGTGDSLRVVTVTANHGFIRAAQGQGVSFAVIQHESRALSEDKEKLATIESRALSEDQEKLQLSAKQ